MPASRNVRYAASFTTRERRCTQCDTWLPQTREHFAYNSTTGRWNSWCKPCVRAHHAQRVAVGRGATGSIFDRSFGVEIEFLGSMAAVATELRRAGLELTGTVGGYTHAVSRTAWKIVSDASVGGGGELVSPVLSGDAGREQVRRASAALVAAGARVSRATGLHVHHDCRNLTVTALRALVTNWAASQGAIDGLVAPSRRDGSNTYCEPFTAREVERLTARLVGDGRISPRDMRPRLSGLTRYKTLNLQSYPKYGTVEVRQHQGTVEADKILAWVEFGQAMVAAAAAGTTLAPCGTTAELLDALPLTAATRTYLLARAAHLARRAARATA